MEKRVNYDEPSSKKKINWKLIIIIASIILSLTTIVIVVAVLLSNSYSTLNENEMGLDFDSGSATINVNTLYLPGKYFLGLSHSFIKFQLVDKITFDDNNQLFCRSNDGISIRMSINYKYILSKNIADIVSLYNRYGSNYETNFYSISRDTICNSISQYDVNQLLNDKLSLSQSILNNLTASFKGEQVKISSLQIIEVNFPENLKNVLNLIEAKSFEVQIAQNNQNSLNIELMNERLRSIVNVGSYLTKSKALNNIYVSECLNRANKIKNTIAKIKDSLVSMKSSLGLSNKDLLSYIYIQNLNNKKEKIQNVEIPKSFDCINDSSLSYCS